MVVVNVYRVAYCQAKDGARWKVVGDGPRDSPFHFGYCHSPHLRPLCAVVWYSTVHVLYALKVKYGSSTEYIILHRPSSSQLVSVHT